MNGEKKGPPPGIAFPAFLVFFFRSARFPGWLPPGATKALRPLLEASRGPSCGSPRASCEGAPKAAPPASRFRNHTNQPLNFRFPLPPPPPPAPPPFGPGLCAGHDLWNPRVFVSSECFAPFRLFFVAALRLGPRNLPSFFFPNLGRNQSLIFSRPFPPFPPWFEPFGPAPRPPPGAPRPGPFLQARLPNSPRFSLAKRAGSEKSIGPALPPAPVPPFPAPDRPAAPPMFLCPPHNLRPKALSPDNPAKTGFVAGGVPLGPTGAAGRSR